MLIAIGIDWDGRRQVLGVEMASRESAGSWKEFLLSLKQRGLKGVEMVVSAQEGYCRGIARGNLAEMLCSFPQECARLSAEKGGRRLSAGIAMAV